MSVESYTSFVSLRLPVATEVAVLSDDVIEIPPLREGLIIFVTITTIDQ